ncbi:MAG: HEAT repeat domain-containing protein, partial [Bacteroidetes bacterium]|nr:HEAT repeat domain-containing protein [Bacteroidota bacterium]
MTRQKHYLTLLLSFLVLCAPAIAQESDKPSIRSLLEMLESPDPSTRVRAVCAIEQSDELAQNRDAVADAMQRHLSDDGAADPTVCDKYRSWGNWSDGRRRPLRVGRQAAGVLAELHERYSIDAPTIFRRAIQGQDNVARANGAWGLGAIDDESGIPLLVNVVRTDSFPRARRDAVWSLGAIGSHKGLAGVEAGLADAEEDVREQAAWAAGAIGADGSGKLVVPLLKDDAGAVREQAAWALGAIDDAFGSTELQDALRDTEASVRE